MTTVLNCKSYYFQFNQEKEDKYQERYPFGGYLGLCDVFIDNSTLCEDEKIFVKDSRDSEWIEAKFKCCHDGEIYADNEYGYQSWRYVSLIRE